MPTRPFVWGRSGMTPILQASGVMTPWLLAPISCDLEPSRARLTRTMSSTGTRSETQTMSGISALMASIIASAAWAGGTKTADASGLVASTASATVSKTGRCSWLVPPFPGTTPPTSLVP